MGITDRACLGPVVFGIDLQLKKFTLENYDAQAACALKFGTGIWLDKVVTEAVHGAEPRTVGGVSSPSPAVLQPGTPVPDRLEQQPRA
jgi:hypothetical protein